ncbi:MAG: type II toxin-antitoxin system VapC family toxin, partial [Planctomycetota bacterium]
YVLDASVGIKLFVEEDDSDKVDALFQGFADDADARLHVPTLFFTECTNILWKLARRGERSADDVQADVRDLISLALDRVDTVPLLPDILLLATERDISVYDATYVVTAQSLGIPLLTADEKLAGKLEGDAGIMLL